LARHQAAGDDAGDDHQSRRGGGRHRLRVQSVQPHLLFRNTTPSGGDMGAHVWQPAYIAITSCPLRLTGWTPDWYAGFPAMVFYFPCPSLAIVVRA